MYQRKSQVAFSDVNYKGEVSAKKILEYFQDVGTFESEDLGDKLEKNHGKSIAWFLLGWHITIIKTPRLSEKITVTTDPYKIRGFYAYRRYTLVNEQGECLVKGDALWIYMDTEKMLPVRIPKDVAKAYLPEPAKDAVTTVEKKLSQEGDWELQNVISVERYHLDVNHHVNNTFYVLWAESLLSDEETIKEIKIEYRQAAFRGDKLNVLLCKEENKYRVMFQRDDGVVNVIVELMV